MKFMYKKSKYDFTYCTISTVSSRILKICWPRWPINFLLSSSDLKQELFFWPLRVTELTVEMVQYLRHWSIHHGTCTGLSVYWMFCPIRGNMFFLFDYTIDKADASQCLLTLYFLPNQIY